MDIYLNIVMLHFKLQYNFKKHFIFPRNGRNLNVFRRFFPLDSIVC